MKNEAWKHVIWSAPEYEKLVADITFEDQFFCQIDWDDGRENVKISFPKRNIEDGEFELGTRVLLNQFIKKLQSVASDLCVGYAVKN